MSFFTDWLDEYAELVAIAVIVGVTIIFIALLFLGVSISEERWAKFAAQHDCKVVAKSEGDVLVSNTIGAKGQVGIATTVTPSKTGYLCNDGITYWR